MACSIASISGDQRIRIGNNEILWGFDFGTNWQYIRVGFLYLVNMSGNISPDMKVGINSGTQFGFRSANCVEYIGSAWTNGSGVGFTFVGGTPNLFQYGAYNVHYKVGSVDTSTNTNSANFFGSATATTRSMGYVDFIKRTGNGQMTVLIGGINSSVGYPDTSPDLFYRYMEYDQTPNGFAPLVINVSYNGPYSFDSLSLLYSDNANTLEITELLVVRYG